MKTITFRTVNTATGKELQYFCNGKHVASWATKNPLRLMCEIIDRLKAEEK